MAGLAATPRSTDPRVAAALHLLSTPRDGLSSWGGCVCEASGPCDKGWREDLPACCPPTGVRDPVVEVVYRLVKSVPATDHDFLPSATLHPGRTYEGPDAHCIPFALSVFETIEACQARRKWPKLRDTHVAGYTLSKGDGCMKPTHGPGHLSWWCCSEFDPASGVHAAASPGGTA